MFAAKKKRKENIIEYIIYMYQIEDTIRACRLDFDKIKNLVISEYDLNKKEKKEIEDWYGGLLNQMKSEGIEKNGHLQFVKNILSDVNELHLWLLKNAQNSTYSKTYNQVRPLLMEYLARTKTDYEHEIEIAINVIYAYIMLKMQKKEIGEETFEAVTEISRLLSLLASNYKNYEAGNFE